ncbi:unnamed protein product [Caenorhabditis angaria]|uniref:Uncharacterized protein n=1 Tax=Caenorhabditis angaria TaxID=860376 RepID=A0A9P1N669_9PELO|nr:unnamed protein product [Caenorhabditis angaria]
MQYFQDAESGTGDKYSFLFTNESVRAGFVRKVFSLVTLMFTVVAGFCVIPFVWADFSIFLHHHPEIHIISFIIFFAISIALSCFESVRRSFPTNIILLAVFTIAASVMTMCVTAHYELGSVLIALLITTVCCGSIIVFSMKTKHDLTSKIGIVFILSMVVFSFGIFAMIFSLILKWKFLLSIYAGVAALLTMFYLAIDIQMLMGGRQFELSPEDYIFAAMQIFLDILNIFLLLLSLFGKSK